MRGMKAKKASQPVEKSTDTPPPLALVGATLAELSPARVRRSTVLVQGGKIAALDEAPPAGALTLDCTGLLILPGLVCAHTHLYSSLARGMPAPSQKPVTFTQILERVWWKLDRALDAEAIEVSALIGALEAARAGTTTVIDHHASPRCTDGSLDLIAGALEKVGIRGVLCYEVSDRGGPDEARAGVRENDRFLAALRKNPRPLVAGMVGAHAAFTLSDRTAEALADVSARHKAGVHIHLAEDSVDAWHEGDATVRWLAHHGLLGPRTLLAHAVHVSDKDAVQIVESAAHVVHNARSNANNGVGYARPGRFADRLLLGTDGIGADMLAELQAAHWAAREHHHEVDLAGALERNRVFAGFAFDNGLGRIELGAPADLVVHEYRSPTPIEEANLGGHVLFGLPSARPRHVIVDGKLVIRDGVALGVDEPALYGRAREVARRLWAAMR
jgi:putative selenium metabolism protein SsnA